MDEANNEEQESAQPAEPVASWTEAEETGAPSPESNVASDQDAFAQAPFAQAPFAQAPFGYAPDGFAPASDGPEAVGRSGQDPGYQHGHFTTGIYGPAAGAYTTATYAPASGAHMPGGHSPQPSAPPRPRRGRKALAAVAVALVLVSASAGAGIAYLSRASQSSAAGLAASPAGHTLTTSQIAALVDPAVVDINTNLGEGTGMIATPNGEIITNNHVVEGASTIKVVIDNRGTYTATVVGTDATADVAVLQLKGVSGLPTVKFGNSSTVAIGSSVVAIGNAGGQGFPSAVTAGAVTALHRTIMASNDTGSTESLTNMIQMDALIEPGNSGGPLVDSAGRVIGMDTAAASADGATPIGFALPINRVLQIANDITRGRAGNGIVIGSGALLGIVGQAVALGSGSTTGVSLELVDPGSPAALAGLQEGDVIIAFDGHSTPTLSALASLIHKLRPGDRASVTFDDLTGSTETVMVTLAAAPPA